MGSVGTATNSVDNYISSWKANEVKAVVGDIKSYRQKYLEWKEKYNSRDLFATIRANVPAGYQDLVRRNVASDDAYTRFAENLVNDHFETLRNKVESKIGKITQINNLGKANDYELTGDTGDTVRIQVVMAGGYNKQRLHTRWVMNKIKK